MSINKKDKIPVLSFFTGGGFMDMGFIEAGFDVVWTNEFEPAFSKFYSEGITSWKNKAGIKGEFKISNTNSIKNINSTSIIQDAFKVHTPSAFGIIGGPPCQDFSINGNLNGFKGDKGSLTDTFLCKILELQPSFFVMENVAGLLRVKKNSKHFIDLIEIMREHFLIDYTILNSINYGVPQSRERLFVVGINKNKYYIDNIEIRENNKWFQFPVNANYINALKKHKWPDPLTYGRGMSKPKDIPLELCVQSCLITKSKEIKIPNADEYFNLIGDKRVLSGIKEGETNRPSFKRLHRYKFSPTTCYGNNEVHLHPYQHRRLSVREALRIQGVSDNYILSQGQPLSKKFKMIGNGVPVPLAKAVALQVLNFIKKLKDR